MGTNNYIYTKGDYEGQVIKNLDIEEVSVLIWSRKFPIELTTKVLENKEEVLAFKIRKNDIVILQEFLTKLNGAPPKRIYEFSPSLLKKEKVSSKNLLTKVKNLLGIK